MIESNYFAQINENASISHVFKWKSDHMSLNPPLSSQELVINSFSGDYSFLSNFYPAQIVIELLVFPTVEHAYQAFKTDDQEWFKKIQNANSPAVAKKLGRRCPIKPNFDSLKLDLMRELVQAKFFQNPELKTKLLATNDSHLEEGNTWGDTYWGIVNGKGSNFLGKILMETRDIIKHHD